MIRVRTTGTLISSFVDWVSAWLTKAMHSFSEWPRYVCVEDEFNVPIALSAFRDKKYVCGRTAWIYIYRLEMQADWIWKDSVKP